VTSSKPISSTWSSKRNRLCWKAAQLLRNWKR